MISAKTLKAIEYDKIMLSVSEYAVLDGTRREILDSSPVTSLKEALSLLNKTREAYSLLFDHGVRGVDYFDDVSALLSLADKGGTLLINDFLKIAGNLRSARIVKSDILSVNDTEIVVLKEIAGRLFTDVGLEKDISDKFPSPDEVSDNASVKLNSIRKNIRNLNARIRERLNSYMRGSMSKYLQDDVVTMRSDRYVVPVKSEYRGMIKGFIHDQSSSGATVFIEPEAVMELNNELKSAMLEEAGEIRRILAEMSAKVAAVSDGIRYNTENLCDLDTFFSKATYSFKNKCTFPVLNDKGITDVKNARHPLIDKSRVVPISFSFGEKYNFLLITGPNTGGKTVTLKLAGLLSLMAMSGLFVPAEEGSKVSVFENVFCDIGDEQSIEQSLSTFSSHISNIIRIIKNVNDKSLVLIDEIGAGTDPEEGGALALAITENLLDRNCFGIITTHYSRLKEFAVENGKIENASMEFDAVTLKPVYKLNIGIPGSSNAIEIAKTLGLDERIINKSLYYVSDKQLNFENVLKKAEESRRETERLSSQLSDLKTEQQKVLEEIRLEKEKIANLREKIYHDARQETKRIVADKLSEAEEIVDELKKILKNAQLESREVFRASELKNRLENSRYLSRDDDSAPVILDNSDINSLKRGDRVYVRSLNVYAEVQSVNISKKEVEVLIGSIKTVVKKGDVFNTEKQIKDGKREKSNVNVARRSVVSSAPQTEINIIGKTSLEAEEELKNFIDQAVVYGLEEIKVIHGVGEGVLLKTVRNYLKKDKNVKEFRRGNYGEGENGVTVIKLK